MASIETRQTSRGPRYDVRFRTPEGVVRTETFTRKAEATKAASTIEADKVRGRWIDPKAATITLDIYAGRWLRDRTDLRPKTRDLYEGLLRLHIGPTLGAKSLGSLTTGTVRTWHADMTRAAADPESPLPEGVRRPGVSTVAKAYRLLRTILNTAVEDGLIAANPCRIKGAGTEHPPERPIVDTAAILAIADAVKPERRLMVLLAGACGLRLGEVLGLRAENLDLLHGVIRVRFQLQEMPDKGGLQELTEPKTAAGRRDVAMPVSVAQVAAEHLAAHVSADGWLFTGDKGGPLRRHVWNAEWKDACQTLGIVGLHYHDLRHADLTALASAGASTAELMAHAGHASPIAALRYQHATKARAVALADLRERALVEARTATDSTVRAMHAR